MRDKIALLMDETGCDQGEAELALEMCGYQVQEAVKTIGRLLKNIAVIKGKFIHSKESQFGLFLVIINIKSFDLLRARAVLSYNPAVYDAPLDKDWFEFEKFLYRCRLWEGSLPSESLDVERRLAAHFRESPPAALEHLSRDSAAAVESDLSRLLERHLMATSLKFQLRKDILALGEFHSLHPGRAQGQSAGIRTVRIPKREEQLVLQVELETEAAGMAATEMRAGDMVSARIVDPRDIAQYLSRVFGGHSEAGPVPILAPLEAIEAVATGAGDGCGQMLARVRFSVGVCGDAKVSLDKRLKVVRIAVRNQEGHSWWRRFFRGT